MPNPVARAGRPDGTAPAMSASVLVVAAGRGDRLGESAPKAFVQLDGPPLLAYAVESIDACPDVASFVVVVPTGREQEAAEIAVGSAKFTAAIAGGDTRQRSVALGLRALAGDPDAVVVHDVARPFAGPALFSRVLAALESADGAVPAVPVADTVKRSHGGVVSETVSRDGLVLVQTPQAFRRVALEAAHARAAAEGDTGTDDAALVERAGFRVVAVDGDPGNFKITTPEDLRLASLIRTGRG